MGGSLLSERAARRGSCLSYRQLRGPQALEERLAFVLLGKRAQRQGLPAVQDTAVTHSTHAATNFLPFRHHPTASLAVTDALDSR